MGHASLLELVRYGTATLEQMARDGEIRPMNIWVAAKGAEKYRKAIVRGDLVEMEAGYARRRVCGQCPHHTERDVFVAGRLIGLLYCGAPFVETEGPNATCGCLVGVTVENEEIPGGKAMVDSERCPQEKWP